MVSKTRAIRIGERIREELSEMILQDIQDPRIAGISFTQVRIDKELAFADIYFSALEGSDRAPEVIEALQHAQGFLRSELARRVEIRHFPKLRFHWDPTFEYVDHIENLFAQLGQDREPGDGNAA
jgi:ribosome-binding factor A